MSVAIAGGMFGQVAAGNIINGNVINYFMADEKLPRSGGMVVRHERRSHRRET